MRTTIAAGVASLAIAAGAASAMPHEGMAAPFARGDEVVYVRSQDLYFDTIVLGDLPPHGRFQLLEMDMSGRLVTEYGPGDVGYLGGRWMADFDGDGEFRYFLCPLLGPGRDEP